MVEAVTVAQQIPTSLARLRSELAVTQSALASTTGLDQSRVSRMEKGEVSSASEVERMLDGLISLGSSKASDFKRFISREWIYIQPPSFWNPQRATLELAEETLRKVEDFLDDEEKPWPLRRQIERYKETLINGSNYLLRISHNIAFIGDIGVGKSTALGFIFDLLTPATTTAKPMDRPILETGAGGTTICEVHIRRGPEFGVAIQPLSDGELRNLVADFCSARWVATKVADKDMRDAAAVSREVERAIRNMTGLTRRATKDGGRTVYIDPVSSIIANCANEDELRTRVLEMMKLGDRTRTDVWYDSATRQHPMEWIAKVFKEVNNGRLPDVTLPKSVDLVIPDFGKEFGELEITIIDTKGVDDVAVREDLDFRLRDHRTAIVFCCKFNDAPGVTSKSLLQHLRQTFSEPVNTGKISIMALPRPEEARAMKDDTGEVALTDEEGYSFKQMQIENELASDDLQGVPVLFYNAQSDTSTNVRASLLDQLNRMRSRTAERLGDSCAAVEDLIENHEAEAMTAAVEEVAKRIKGFLDAHTRLGAREILPQSEALVTIRGVRHASTLWAATRRNGEYSGLNIIHQIGVGTARDATARSRRWFTSFADNLKAMKKDVGLALAVKNIDQIARSASATRTAFLEAVQRAGMEVYHEPLTKAPVWNECVSEWGRGQGFKMRVASRLEDWFSNESNLKDKLEEMVNTLWERTVIAPLVRLVEEGAPAPEAAPTGVVVKFVKRA